MHHQQALIYSKFFSTKIHESHNLMTIFIRSGKPQSAMGETFDAKILLDCKDSFYFACIKFAVVFLMNVGTML